MKRYKFSGLESFSHDEVNRLNRAVNYLADTSGFEEILKATSGVLFQFDICNLGDIEISLLVKPIGHIGKPQVRRLLQPVIGFGRTSDNDVQLKSPVVSKKHAIIFRRGPDYFLKDSGSNNGTYINQTMLESDQEVLLKNEDVIKIEPFEIKVGLPQNLSMAKKPLDIEKVHVRSVRQPETSGRIAILLQEEPSGKQLALLVGESGARWLVQRIFMGQQDNLMTPWTDIETGLMEYLACRVLFAVNGLLKESRIVMRSAEPQPEAIQKWFSQHESFVEVSVGSVTEIGNVYASLYYPDAIFPDVPKSQKFLFAAPWIWQLPYTFYVQVGSSSLTPAQIDQLESGDIILLDRSTIRLTENRAEGDVFLQSLNVRRTSIHGSLEYSEDGEMQIKILGVNQEGLEPMTETKKLDEEESADSMDVVGNVEVPVVVELARVQFTLEELSLLKDGQIVELKKSSPEVVDLSVEGKVIANGKLVDIEGKLGVQIGRIAKGKARN